MNTTPINAVDKMEILHPQYGGNDPDICRVDRRDLMRNSRGAT